MKKTSFVCDFCGKEIKGDGTRLISVSFDGNGGFTETADADEFHFCKRCNAAMIMELDKTLSGKTKEKEAPKRKMLDTGKVMALSNAGWSNEKIAEEMKVSERQIYQCIRHQKNKKDKAVAGKEKDEE